MASDSNMRPIDPNDTRTSEERIAAGDWYQTNAAQWGRLLEANRKVSDYNKTLPYDVDAAVAMLPDIFGTVGEGCFFRDPIKVDYGKNTHWGKGCFANYGLIALDVAPIHVGDGSMFGSNVQLMTPIHPIDPEFRATGFESALPITIGRNVWVGSGAIVLGGVTIGDDSVIGAGAVVTKDVPARSVAVGNPARVIKTL
jgi:maltose O-acetyltransferase